MKKLIAFVSVLTLLITACGSNETKISADKAKEIALAEVPGATAENIREFKKEFDDGREEYDGKIVYNKTEYEFEIDAETGEIIKWETD